MPIECDACFLRPVRAVRIPGSWLSTPISSWQRLRSRNSKPLTRLIPALDSAPVRDAGRIYIVDPLGNLMMSYAAAAPDDALLDDLERLLRLSHIG